jgi:hypothetical protein
MRRLLMGEDHRRLSREDLDAKSMIRWGGGVTGMGWLGFCGERGEDLSMWVLDGVMTGHV